MARFVVCRRGRPPCDRGARRRHAACRSWWRRRSVGGHGDGGAGARRTRQRRTLTVWHRASRSAQPRPAIRYRTGLRPASMLEIVVTRPAGSLPANATRRHHDVQTDAAAGVLTCSVGWCRFPPYGSFPPGTSAELGACAGRLALELPCGRWLDHTSRHHAQVLLPRLTTFATTSPERDAMVDPPGNDDDHGDLDSIFRRPHQRGVAAGRLRRLCAGASTTPGSPPCAHQPRDEEPERHHGDQPSSGRVGLNPGGRQSTSS